MQIGPIQNLYDDHRQVENRLGRLDALLAAPADTPGLETDLESIVRFLEEDLEIHLLHEERGLFPVLERYIGREAGPIAVMLMEHAEMRRLVGGLRQAFDAWRQQRNPATASALSDAARQAAGLLYEHIAKEDQVLFPLAQRAFAESDVQEVGERMAAVNDPAKEARR